MHKCFILTYLNFKGIAYRFERYCILKFSLAMNAFQYHLYIKELSFCHKLRFSNFCNLATRFPRPLIFQLLILVDQSLKYQYISIYKGIEFLPQT